MSSFKEKKRKKIYKLNNSRTLNDDINIKFTKFQNDKLSYTKKNETLIKMKKEYDKLDKILLKDLDDSKLEYKLTLNEKIIDLEKNLNNIKSNKNINSFLINNNHLLYNYFSTENENNKEIHSDSILNFFSKKSNTIDKSDSCDKSDSLYKSNDRKYNKLSLLNKYFNKINIDSFEENKDIYEICNDCNIEKIYYEIDGILVCEKCGVQKTVIIDIDRPSFKEPPKEISYFAYKRINHFNEWLAQLQAKESTDIPKEIYNLIKLELKKEIYIDMTTLKISKIRGILKKLGLNKYYEHVPHIINRLNGITPPILDYEVEMKLRMMFKEIQTPWIKHCPTTRSNFLSYSYVLYKCLQLLEMDQFLKSFNLLKSREKLAEQDQLWKLICKDVKWQFIKTI